jgi:uncharacterized membrane protein
MRSRFVVAARWTLAGCCALVLPLAGFIMLIFAGYAVIDAIRTFGAPALLVILAIVVGGNLLRKRHAKAGRAVEAR